MSRPARPARTYPRSARVNEVVRESIADELERMNDPRLSLVTITGCDVAPDLRTAKVYFGALDQVPAEVAEALQHAAPHLRAVLGREVRMKYLPRLEFFPDPAIEAGQRVEDILREIHAEGGE